MSSGCFHFGNNHIFLKFTRCKDVLNLLGDSWNFCFKQFRNLTLSKPDCFAFDSYILYGCLPVEPDILRVEDYLFPYPKVTFLFCFSAIWWTSCTYQKALFFHIMCPFVGRKFLDGISQHSAGHAGVTAVEKGGQCLFVAFAYFAEHPADGFLNQIVRV